MPETNGKKVGGIPSKYWYVIGAVAAIVLYEVYKHYKNDSATTALQDAEDATGSSTDGTSTGEEPVTDASTTTTTTSTPISTLSQWITAGTAWAVSTLGSDPGNALDAFTNYQNGSCLTAAEYQIVDQAIGALGVPPDAPYGGLVQCPDTGDTGTTTSPTPTPTTNTPATPSDVPSSSSLNALLDQAVGALSTELGRNSSPTQISSWTAAAAAQGLTGDAADFFTQTQNVGQISSGLSTPTQTQIQALAASLAGGSTAYGTLPTLQQQQYNELANVQLLQSLNTKPK